MDQGLLRRTRVRGFGESAPVYSLFNFHLRAIAPLSA
jgi:hypothetical protein